MRIHCFEYICHIGGGNTPSAFAFLEYCIAYFSGLLSSIIPNLKYDDAKTVAVVLTVLKEKMLTNPAVPKTLKLNIFNTQV